MTSRCCTCGALTARRINGGAYQCVTCAGKTTALPDLALKIVRVQLVAVKAWTAQGLPTQQEDTNFADRVFPGYEYLASHIAVEPQGHVHLVLLLRRIAAEAVPEQGGTAP